MPKLPQGFKPLIGTDNSLIDEKGRVLVNKDKRDRLGENFVMILGKNGGVIMYPEPVWQMLFEEIFAVETMNPFREEYTRLVLGTAFDGISFDQQGRMVVPKRLREEARLTDEVLLIGCGDRIELWDRDEWVKFNFAPEKYNNERRDAIEEAYSKMLFGHRAAQSESA